MSKPKIHYYKFRVPGYSKWLPLKATQNEDVTKKCEQVDKNAYNLTVISKKEFDEILEQTAQ